MTDHDRLNHLHATLKIYSLRIPCSVVRSKNLKGAALITLKRLIATLLIPFALSACDRSEQPAPVKVSDNTVAAAQPGQSAKSEFASRLDAAKGIGNLNERDLACSKLAIDAAASGDEEVTKGAVLLIASSQLHDETASKAGLRLAKAGKGEGANAVVKLIGDSNLQDQARAKIAKGEFGP